MKDELYWLVETKESQNFNIHWLCCIDGNLTFQKDEDLALRFARREDAEVMSKIYTACVVTGRFDIKDY